MSCREVFELQGFFRVLGLYCWVGAVVLHHSQWASGRWICDKIIWATCWTLSITSALVLLKYVFLYFSLAFCSCCCPQFIVLYCLTRVVDHCLATVLKLDTVSLLCLCSYQSPVWLSAWSICSYMSKSDTKHVYLADFILLCCVWTIMRWGLFTVLVL